MYLAQVMMDSRTKVDQWQEDLMSVCAEFQEQCEEWKVLEDFQIKYQPEMHRLREGKQKLHDVAA